MNLPSNIKDILSIPSGSRNVAASSYSSLTDSQLWPENSQSTSQDLCLSSRNAQQGSQEGSDQTILNAYLAKPLLFGDLNDKTRTSWILGKFEEDRRKAKEKTESELLMKECEHIKETLNSIQHLVGTEQNAAVCQTVLEKFDNFASTLQNNLNRLQSEISQQFDARVNKVTLQTEMMCQILQKSLEGLKEEQDRERRMLEKALEHLSTLVSWNSFRPGAEQVVDRAIQTSPLLLHSMLEIMQEGAQLTRVSPVLEKTQAEVSSQQKRSGGRMRKITPRATRRRKKMPAGLSQRSKCAVADENAQPLVNKSKRALNRGTSHDVLTPNPLIPLNGENRTGKASRRSVPPQYWSQEGNSPIGRQDVTPIIEKLSAECNVGTLATPVSFWQLFETNDSDVEP